MTVREREGGREKVRSKNDDRREREKKGKMRENDWERKREERRVGENDNGRERERKGRLFHSIYAR